MRTLVNLNRVLDGVRMLVLPQLMITLQDLSMHYGGKELFNNVDLILRPKNRYGLIGANGSGKSTFLRMLLGEEEPTSGNLEIGKNLKVSSLKQDQYKYEDTRIIDVVLRGNKALWNAMAEQSVLTSKKNLTNEEGCRIAELECTIAENDGYSAESNAEILLHGLGISEKYYRQPLSVLSGGFKVRVLLAQCLFGNPDVLLLDEPTNHVDILSIQWLESFLKEEFKTILILISHDHDFLNATCNKILDIDYKSITLYHGNYDQFVQEKALNAELIGNQRANIEKKIKKDQAFVDKFRASASRSSQAKSREKQLQKIEMPELKKTSRVAPRFFFKQHEKSGREVLEITGLSQSFGELKLFQNLSCSVQRAEKIAILGQNGIGKSTMLKTILGLLSPSSGTTKWGHNVKTSYFSQDHRDLLKGNASAVNWLMQAANISEPEKARAELGKMLFTKDEAHKSIDVLSGGEASRLLFAKILLEQPNVLVLDEPTNHLDLESRTELAEALSRFEGTIIFVSHDRNFISTIATRIIFLYDKGFVDYQGDYGSFREKYSKFF